jgi:hypothetical protein
MSCMWLSHDDFTYTYRLGTYSLVIRHFFDDEGESFIVANLVDWEGNTSEIIYFKDGDDE